MPDAVVIAEAPSGELLLANERARALTGRQGGGAEPTLDDEGALELFHPDGRRYDPEDWPILRAARHGEEVLDEEYFQLAADGTRIWLSTSCAPVRDPGGRIVAAVAVARDVTAQRRAEEALSYHAGLLSNIEDAVITTDAQFQVTAWNRGAERLYGWSAAEVLGSDVRDVARSDLGDARRAEARQTLLPSGRSSGETILESITDAYVAVDREWRYTYVNERALRRMEWREGSALTREDVLGHGMWEMFPEAVGTELYDRYHEAMREQRPLEFEAYFAPTDEWIEAYAYPSESGLSIHYRNISARKLAEQEMDRRAEQQAVVAALGRQALASEDLQSLMDEAVRLVARTLGVEMAAVTELAPGGGEVIFRAGVGWQEGVVGARVDRTLTAARFTASPIARDHGLVSALVVSIEARGEPFGTLAATSTRQKTFSPSEVSFVQGVANVLAGAVERNRAADRLIEMRELERRRIARDLHDEALQDLTQALALAGGHRGRQDELTAALKRVGEQLRGAIYDLRLGGERDKPFRALLEALVDVHRAMAPDCEVEQRVGQRVPAGSLGATGIEVLRILGEALTNARRHSRAAHVRVRVWGSARRVCAEVSDDGRGFDPADSSLTVNGSGIRGMRERAGLIPGELAIQSEPGAGTSVRIDVQLTGDGEESAGPLRVLLVEDHASVRQAIASAFRREADFEVVGEAASLAEARELLNDVDVAVLDLGLPDGCGADLIHDLRTVNRRAQALVLSATLDRGEVARAVQSGAAGVLDKTASLDEVVDAVRRVSAGETLLPMEEILELLRFAGRQREREHDERQALAELTAREREILRALADGLNTERAADRLHISIRTARNHINNILAKLGVHSQLQALVLALRYGIVVIHQGPASDR
jgi:PAS domain S-box-containing protein